MRRPEHFATSGRYVGRNTCRRTYANARRKEYGRVGGDLPFAADRREITKFFAFYPRGITLGRHKYCGRWNFSAKKPGGKIFGEQREQKWISCSSGNASVINLSGRRKQFQSLTISVLLFVSFGAVFLAPKFSHSFKISSRLPFIGFSSLCGSVPSLSRRISLLRIRSRSGRN